jgi:hypothetical protein
MDTNDSRSVRKGTGRTGKAEDGTGRNGWTGRAEDSGLRDVVVKLIIIFKH